MGMPPRLFGTVDNYRVHVITEQAYLVAIAWTCSWSSWYCTASPLLFDNEFLFSIHACLVPHVHYYRASAERWIFDRQRSWPSFVAGGSRIAEFLSTILPMNLRGHC